MAWKIKSVEKEEAIILIFKIKQIFKDIPDKTHFSYKATKIHWQHI